MRKTALLILTFGIAVVVFAQRPQIRPDWMLEKPAAGNGTYEYVIEHGVGLTETAALEEAIQHVHEYYIRRLGGGIISSQSGVTMQNETFSIPFKKVCEYTEKQSDGTYCVYVLCQVAMRGDIVPRFEDYRQCNSITKFKSYMHKKDVTAIVASVFLPGVGQMTKRHYGEGIGTLLGEGALIGGGVAMLTLSNKQKTIMDDASGTLTYDDYQAAKSKYNTFRYTAYGLFGAAAVVYGVNLWRAWACRYRFKEMAFYPTAIPMEREPMGLAFGVGMNINF